MELRPRAAQKSRLVAGSAIEADASDSSLDEEWQPPPGPSDASADDECQRPPRLSAAESTEATSTTSDGAQQIHVACPPAQTKAFSSWQALETYLAAYTAQTFQVFRRRSNTSVKERNARIDDQGSTATQIPDSREQYSKTFVCTYHGKYTSQASGKRPRQESRKRGCGAKISACVQKVKGDSNTFEINMTRWCLEHNHRLAEFDYLQHPSNRISMDDETMGTVDELRNAGAKSTSILRFITDNSDSNPKPRDVQNLVRRLKLREEGKGPSNSGKRLKKLMAEFGEQPGNVGRIFVATVNDKRVSTCITLQTKHMRALFDQFPEVLLIDATHGTNRSKYKVFSFMAHDTFGKGQFVQHALLQNERWPTLLTALEEFKSNNPAWTKLKCVLIDKDFTELSVLRKAFPDVTILLCQFHVLKYLREEIASSDYAFNGWQKKQLRGIMSLLVYARTESEYAKYFRYMVHIASIGVTSPSTSGSGVVGVESGRVGVESGRVGVESGRVGVESGIVGVESGANGVGSTTNGVASDANAPAEDATNRYEHPFVMYFRRNWDNCRELWCAHKRQNTVTLGNNTNNRLEASWKQLKEWVDSFMSVDECIASIMYYQSLQEKQLIAEINKNVVVRHVGYDAEMTLVANIVSEHACELIHEQYVYALGPVSYTYNEGCPGIYFIKNAFTDDGSLDENNAEYSVNKRNWTSSCLFMSTRLLPRRHVLYLRKHSGKETVIPTQLLNKRWLISTIRTAIDFVRVCDEIPVPTLFAVKSVLHTDDRPWDSNRKYREAFPIAAEICDSMAGLGMPQYRQAMSYLQDVARQFKDGNFSIHGRDESHPVAPVATAHLESQRDDQHTRSRNNQTSNQIAGPADSDNESATQPGESGIPFDQLGIQPSTSGIEVGESDTQSCIEVGESGIQSGIEVGESGIEVGESGIQSGIGSGESGIQSGASDIEVRNHLGRSMETRGLGNQTEPGARLPLVPAGHVPFSLTTPPRARGRPKRTPRAKKAARNKVVATAKDDSEMYASNLTLAAGQTALSNNATYESSASTLSQFKMFDYSTKLKAPIPRKVSCLPATKPLMDPASITRILRPDYIKTCYSKMIAFQNKHRTSHTVLAEKDVAYEIVGYGVYSTDTVRTMKGWHQAMKVIKHVENAISWVETIDFAIPMPSSFQVTRETDLLRNVKLIPLLPAQAEVLELVGKAQLGDATINTVLAKLFDARSDVIVINPNVIV